MGEQWDTEYWLLTDWFCKLNDKPVHGVSEVRTETREHVLLTDHPPNHPPFVRLLNRNKKETSICVR